MSRHKGRTATRLVERGGAGTIIAYSGYRISLDWLLTGKPLSRA